MNARRSGKQLPQNHTRSATVIDIPVEHILQDPHQPRRQFNDERIRELGKSIKSQGLQQLPVVNFAHEKNGIRYYYIKAGERRWQAHKKAGMDVLSCVLDPKPYDGSYDVTRVLAQAAENSSREPHTHSEIIAVVESVVHHETELRGGGASGAVQAGLERVAEAFGKSSAWASNYQTLTRLLPELRSMLDSEDDELRLSFNVACSLARAPADVQKQLLQEAQEHSKRGGHIAMQRYVAHEARKIREDRGEIIRGKRPSDERVILKRLIATLDRLAINFSGVRHSSEHKRYIEKLLAPMDIIDIDELLGSLKVSLTTFGELRKILEVTRETRYNKFK